jgi:membrane-bound lytic murein transglycosylase MltF
MRDPARLQRALSPSALARQRKIEPILREAAGQYGFDWLFLAALAFKESAFDAGARNPSGAVGLFQVKPETGAWVGYPDVSGPRESALAGAAYLARLRGDYYDDERLPMTVRLHFTLAAYNAGPGRVAGLRRKAAARGLDPDLWFDNVELVALDTIGHETPDYVASIVRTYVAYRLAADRVKAHPVPDAR